jgi:hypothetical protein
MIGMSVNVTKIGSGDIDKNCFGVRSLRLENSTAFLRKKSAMDMSKSSNDFFKAFLRKYIAEQLLKLVFALFWIKDGNGVRVSHAIRFV